MIFLLLNPPDLNPQQPTENLPKYVSDNTNKKNPSDKPTENPNTEKGKADSFNSEGLREKLRSVKLRKKQLAPVRGRWEKL